MINTTEESTILLICVGLEPLSQKLKELSTDDLHDLFVTFGDLVKVIIFSKKVHLKAFIEFTNFKNARVACNALHKTKMNDLGPILIYFSALQKLDFSNKYLSYKEYTPVKRVSHQIRRNSSRLSVSETMILAEEAVKFKDTFPQIQDFSNRIILGEKKHFCNSNQKTIGNAFKRNSENGMKKEPQAILQTGKSCLENNKSQIEDPLLGTSRRRDSTLAPVSDVILLSNLHDCFFTAKQIHSVFSSFGNIVKILFMKNLKKALVEYSSQDSAQNALTAMNLRMLGNSILKVNFSKFDKIDLKKNNKTENSQNFNEVVIISDDLHRFEDCSLEGTSCPSDTLLFMFQESIFLKPMELFLHVQNFGKVTGTRILANFEEKEEATFLRVLFKFKDQNESIQVLAMCHNTEVNGVELIGSFSEISL